MNLVVISTRLLDNAFEVKNFHTLHNTFYVNSGPILQSDTYYYQFAVMVRSGRVWDAPIKQ